jgi:hypothetical protein
LLQAFYIEMNKTYDSTGSHLGVMIYVISGSQSMPGRRSRARLGGSEGLQVDEAYLGEFNIDLLSPVTKALGHLGFHVG